MGKNFENLCERLSAFLRGENLYEMANLGPKKTGLPYGIWISHKGSARHGPRIKAYPNGYSDKKAVIVISVDSNPSVIRRPRSPKVSAQNVNRLIEYVKKNEGILRQYWDDNDMDTDDLVAGLISL